MKYRLFQTESGDWYKIPVEQYDNDTKAYWESINEDWKLATKMEEGLTGWIPVSNIGSLLVD